MLDEWTEMNQALYYCSGEGRRGIRRRLHYGRRNVAVTIDDDQRIRVSNSKKPCNAGSIVRYLSLKEVANETYEPMACTSLVLEHQ